MDQAHTARPRLIFLVATGLGCLSAIQASQAFALLGEAPRPFVTLLGLNLGYWYAWALLTPLVLWLARRFPLDRERWKRSLPVHVLAVLLVTYAHVVLAESSTVQVMSLTGQAMNVRFPFWERIQRNYVMSFDWEMATYWAIIGFSHAAAYYRQAQDRTLRASQLETRLAEAQLQALQRQLHPHFLFNTLNAISALMHRDVEAADQMLSRLSDLLRMALDLRGTQEVSRFLIDGFFPAVARDARPAQRARGALTQLGLPYAQDAAVTRHLAAFLGRQASALGGTGSMLHPTAVLFNGGVMKSDRLRQRILDVLGAWLAADGKPAPRVLEGGDLDHAVAVGAAWYGQVRKGKGLRIRGGTVRSYYVGIESAVPAVPGLEPPLTALCVAPFGMEEGSRADLPDAELGLVVGEPVTFKFFGSTVRRDDRAGALLEHWKGGELEELPPIEAALPAEGRQDGDVVPVKLEASVTEVGTLLLEAVPVTPLKKDERWKIELSVRGEAAQQE